MKALGGIALVGLLLLTGCAATEAATRPTAEAQADEPAGVQSAAQIVTLEDGLAYAKTVEEDSAEIGATARALSDLTGDLPTMSRNTINQDLASLNAATFASPDDGAPQRVELWRIVSEIKTAQAGE